MEPEEIVLDPRTAAYFDAFTPHFDPYEGDDFAIEFLRKHAGADQSLIEVGSGNGSGLLLVRERTPLRDLTGLDSSRRFLDLASQRSGCKTIRASILDRAALAAYVEGFDYCVVGSMLHNLVARTRRESRQAAGHCLRIAYSLVRPGGYLIVFEPAFDSRWAMDVLFWIKRTVSRFTDSRVQIPGVKHSLGLPLLSFYTRRELDSMFAALDRAVPVTRTSRRRSRAGILGSVAIGAIFRKPGPDGPDLAERADSP